MKQTTYVAKQPDEHGIVAYTDEENAVWKTLYDRQLPIVKQYACDEYLHGLDVLQLSQDRIPQLPEVNACLAPETGWNVEPVAALIGFETFFKLLANRKFPAATFIRRHEELDYLQEPDIFHEIFGHCPMLTNQVYADFMQKYGELGIHASHKERVMLARFYWFTVEFGLIQTQKGMKVYGGGILSSIGETPFSVNSSEPARKPFDVLEMLRTPYRIDIFQCIYFVIQNYEQIYNVLNQDMMGMIAKAMELGLYPPAYPPKEPVEASG